VGRRLPLVLLGAVVAGWAGVGSAASAVDRAWEHVEDAVAGGLEPVDFHHLALAFATDDLHEDWTAGDQMLDRLAGARRADPLVADHVRWLRARRDVAAGRPAAARERFRTMGGLERWWAHGPAPIDELEDFVRRESPAADLLEWRHAPGTDPLGWVRLAGLAWPTRRHQVLLATTVDSPREQPVAIRLGASQAAKVWLNGEAVLTTAFPLDRAPDQAAAGGRLVRGRNLLVVAVASESDDWWLRVRLTGPDGGPLAAPVREVDEPPRPAAPAAGRRPDVRTLEGELRSAAAAGRPAAAVALAAFLVEHRPQAVGAGDARDWCRTARAEAPGAARLLEWRLGADPSTARALLAEALRYDPDLHAARIALARWLLDRGLLEQGLEVLGEDGDAAAVRATMLDLEATAWGALPLPRLEALADRHPACVEVLRLLAHRAMDARRLALARDALARLRRLAPGAAGTLEIERRLAVACNDGAAQRALLERLLDLDPNQPDLRVRIARLRAADGELESARRVLADGLERAPTQVELLMETARVERLQGDDAAAVRLARRVLELRPQSADARRLLSLLGAGGESRDWLRGADELWRMADAATAGTEPVVALVEHTRIRFLPGQLTEERAQRVYLVRSAERAESLRIHTLAWVPESQQLRVLAARVLRRDGRELAAQQRDTPRLAEPEINLYYDTRLRVLEMPELEDGDLVEIAFIRSETAESNETGPYKGGLLPIGRPVPVRLAEVELQAPPEQLPEWRVAHLDGVPERTVADDGAVTLRWSWRDVPAVPDEVPPPPGLLVTPHLVYSNHPDWGGLADWYERHVAPRVRASRQVEEVAIRLTEGVEDRLERIARIYRFVADEIRYVSLAFGEHRFRPFSADWVLNHRIGDCKDTAALLVAMFGAVDIPARFVMVRTADQGPVAADLGLLEAFNHAIVYLPEDDLWLDGTASGHAAFPPPAMDQDAWVLVLEGLGSRPRRTPAPGSGAARSEWRLERREDGSVGLELRLEETGEAADRRRAQLSGSQDPRRVASLVQGFFPGADVTATPTVELYSGRDPVVLEVEAVVPAGALSSGGGIATYPGRADWVGRLMPGAGRTTPMLVPMRPDLRWTLSVQLGRPPRELPADVDVDTPFGALRIDLEPGPTGYEVAGSLSIVPGLVEAADAPALRDFLIAVRRHLERPLESP